MESFSVILIILTLIENVVISLLITAFLSLKFKLYKFIFLFTGVSVVSLFLRIVPVSPLIILLFSFFTYIVLLNIFYNVSYYIGGLTTLLCLIIYFLLESTFIPLAADALSTNLQIVSTESVLRLVFFVPQGAAMVLLSLAIKQKKVNLNNFLDSTKVEELEYIKKEEINLDNENKITRTMHLATFFLIIQGLFIISSNWTDRIIFIFQANSFFRSRLFISVIIVSLTIILLWLIHHLLIMFRLQQNELIQKIRMKYLSKMDWEIKMQHHDLNHHFGLIYMMLKMGKAKKAEKYLESVVEEMDNVKEIVKTGSQVFNALLYSKIALSQNKGIDVKVDVTKPIGELLLPNWELTRIIGNLMNNAIEALENVRGKKCIEIIITGGKNFNTFEIKTVGKVISKEIEEHIFERGYSTKKEEGHGLGLAICKELVDKYNGDIFITRDIENCSTSFIVRC